MIVCIVNTLPDDEQERAEKNPRPKTMYYKELG